MAEEQKTLDPDLTPIRVLADAFKADAAEDQRLAAVDLAKSKVANDKIMADRNTETQWAPLIFSILGRNYEGALEAWNGGRVRDVEAFGPDNKLYIQRRNSRGSTGELFDSEGTKLSPEQMRDIEKRGWIVSKDDMTAAQGGEFQGIRQGALGLRKAPFEQVAAAYKKASEQAVSSSGIANQWDELAKIAARSRNSETKRSWLDVYNKLSPEERAKLSAISSVQMQSAQGSTREAGTAAGTNVQQQQGATQQKGARFDTGVSGTAGATGKGSQRGGVGIAPSMGTGVDESRGASAGVQAGVSGSATTGAGTSSSSGLQQQASFRTQVESILQGKMSDTEFTDFQRFLQLNNSLNEIQANRKPEDMAPGAERLGEIDPLLSGQKNVAITAFKGMKNEALLSEWSHFIADKTNSSQGKNLDIAKLAKEFQESDIAKAIRYRYDSNINEVRDAKPHKPKDGDISVNNRNQLIVYRNGEWERKK
jgi:hypothetical protein